MFRINLKNWSFKRIKTLWKYKKLFPEANNEANETKTTPNQPILSVENLEMLFPSPNGTIKQALNNVSFNVYEKDFFGIIGESGSGKTTVGRCIMRMYNPTGGSINFQDRLISGKKLKKSELKWFHKNVQMIFQDPGTSVNPVKSVFSIVGEPLIINGIARKNAFEFIKKINTSKKYFKISYDEFLEDHYAKDKLAHWSNVLKANQRFNHYLKNINLEDFENGEDFLEYVGDRINVYTNKLKRTLSKIQDLAVEQKNFFENCYSKYEQKDYDSVNLEIELLQQEIAKTKVLTKKSQKQLDLYAELVKNEKALIDYEDDFANFYDTVLVEMKKSILQKTNTQYLTNNQNAILETNNLIKQKLYALESEINYNLKKCLLSFYSIRYLRRSELVNIEKFVSKHFYKFYDSKKEQLKTMLENFAQNSDLEQKKEILKFINEFHSFGKKFNYERFTDPKKFLVKFFKNDNEMQEKFLAEFDHYAAKSQARLERYKKEIINYKTNSVNLKNLITIEKQRLATDDTEFKNAQKRLLELKLQLRIVKDQYNSLFKTSKHNYKLKQIHTKRVLKEVSKIKFQAIKQDMINNLLLRKTFFDMKKQDFKKVPFFQKWSNWKTNNKFWNTFVPKWTGRKMVDQQYTKINDRLRLFSLVFKFPKILTWLFYFNVRQELLLDNVYAALDEVGLKNEFAHRYPHEFSGGQRQRIVIARALITNPKLIIADEAISALDVSIQSRVVKIMQELCQKKGITFLFIAHDLSMVNYACNRLIIMHNGKIVERGNVDEVFAKPAHIYTQSLMKAIPELSAIDKNLADIDNDDLLYALEYNEKNVPSYHKVKEHEDHEIFASNAQLLRWSKK